MGLLWPRHTRPSMFSPVACDGGEQCNRVCSPVAVDVGQAPPCLTNEQGNALSGTGCLTYLYPLPCPLKPAANRDGGGPPCKSSDAPSWPARRARFWDCWGIDLRAHAGPGRKRPWSNRGGGLNTGICPLLRGRLRADPHLGRGQANSRGGRSRSPHQPRLESAPRAPAVCANRRATSGGR